MAVPKRFRAVVRGEVVAETPENSLKVFGAYEPWNEYKANSCWFRFKRWCPNTCCAWYEMNSEGRWVRINA